jgi:hypothetical protein
MKQAECYHDTFVVSLTCTFRTLFHINRGKCCGFFFYLPQKFYGYEDQEF